MYCTSFTNNYIKSYACLRCVLHLLCKVNCFVETYSTASFYFRLTCNTKLFRYRKDCAESKFARFDQLDHCIYSFTCYQLYSYRLYLCIMQVVLWCDSVNRRLVLYFTNFSSISPFFFFFNRNILLIHCLLCNYLHLKIDLCSIFNSKVYI